MSKYAVYLMLKYKIPNLIIVSMSYDHLSESLSYFRYSQINYIMHYWTIFTISIYLKFESTHN